MTLSLIRAKALLYLARANGASNRRRHPVCLSQRPRAAPAHDDSKRAVLRLLSYVAALSPVALEPSGIAHSVGFRCGPGMSNPTKSPRL